MIEAIRGGAPRPSPIEAGVPEAPRVAAPRRSLAIGGCADVFRPCNGRALDGQRVDVKTPVPRPVSKSSGKPQLRMVSDSLVV